MLVLVGVGDLERLVVTVITSVMPLVGMSGASVFTLRLRRVPS